MDAAASIPPAPGDLRVSDADRDRALAELSEHYQAGRLTLEEFDERSAQALQSRTARELSGLFTDLPAAHPGAPATGQALAVPGARPQLTAGRVIAAAAGIAAIVIVVSVLARTGLGQHVRLGRQGFGVPVPFLVLLFIVVRMVSWRRWRRSSARPDAPVQDR